MKNFLRAIFTATYLMCAGFAQASIVNFIDLIESGGYGESAWNPLALTIGGVNVSITGHMGNTTGFAYLDWGNAGLGVCKSVFNSADVVRPGKSSNICNPDSDDNVSSREFVRFVFDQNVKVSNLWFNNNHDGGFVAGDKVNIAGNDYNVATGYAGGANGIGSFMVNAGDFFDVAYSNKQFYIDGIEIARSNVAEPNPTLLLGLGLLALAGIRRAKLRNNIQR